MATRRELGVVDISPEEQGNLRAFHKRPFDLLEFAVWQSPANLIPRKSGDFVGSRVVVGCKCEFGENARLRLRRDKTARAVRTNEQFSTRCLPSPQPESTATQRVIGLLAYGPPVASPPFRKQERRLKVAESVKETEVTS